MRLFYAAETCSLAVIIALEEAALPYEPMRIDFAVGEQRSKEYLAVNPRGRVPALVTSAGVLTETPALLLYVAQSSPAAGLAPLSDAFALARAQEFNSFLCSTVHVAHAHRMRGHRWADDASAIAAMQRKVPEAMTAHARMLEDRMVEEPWVLGKDYSVCDAYLFALGRFLPADGVDLRAFPRLVRHAERMAWRPAVRRALAIEEGGRP
jgi:glutathione S-transferase